MAEDFYSQDSSDEQQQVEDASPEKEGSDDSNTQLVDNSFFGDKELEVGSKCEVEIVRVYDGETEIKYVAHDEGKTDKPSGADTMIDEMALEEV